MATAHFTLLFCISRDESGMNNFLVFYLLSVFITLVIVVSGPRGSLNSFRCSVVFMFTGSL